MNLSTLSFKILKTPFIIIMIFLFFECGFRIINFGEKGLFQFWNYSPQALNNTSIIENDRDSVLVYRMKRNLNTRYKGVELKTNSEGFRNKEFNITSNKISIAILGRSLSFGSGVKEQFIWPNVLQDKVKNNKNKFEIMNYSVPGYKLNQVIQNYNLNVKKYNPPIIFLPIFLAEWYIPLRKLPNKIENSFVKRWSRPTMYLGHLFVYWAIRRFIKSIGQESLASDWRVKAEVITRNPNEFLFYPDQLKKFVMKLNKDGKKVFLITMPRPEQSLRLITEKIRPQLRDWVKGLQNVEILHLDLSMGGALSKT
ncbi:MAG: hypothetical protein HN576_14840 [Bacteriovoracaceae bacterium]|nr:hypothetical protein [Bacteriovoracaceae bacterium]